MGEECMAHRASRANWLPFSQKNTGLIMKHGIIPSYVNSACPPPITTFHSPPPPSWITNTRSVEDVGCATHPGGWVCDVEGEVSGDGGWGVVVSHVSALLSFPSGPWFQERRHTSKECPIGASCTHRSEIINQLKFSVEPSHRIFAVYEVVPTIV